MSAYGALAAWYDALTRDVDYAAFADFYEQCFQQGRGACHTLLDFCCGTGTLTCLMAARGYEMIATDGSPDMLMQAQAHNADLPADAVPPLLLCQAGLDTIVCLPEQEQFVAQVKGARLIRYETARHEIYNSTDDVMERYVDDVIGFLSE